MTLKILADEGLNGNFVRTLRSEGYDVEWILEDNSGISDDKVIELAKTGSRILITEDKDFGEWVFAHKISGLTIIFLRYSKGEYLKVCNFLISTLKSFDTKDDSSNYFITINRNKVRIRTI